VLSDPVGTHGFHIGWRIRGWRRHIVCCSLIIRFDSSWRNVFETLSIEILHNIVLGLVRLDTEPVSRSQVFLEMFLVNVVEAFIPCLHSMILERQNSSAEPAPEPALTVPPNAAFCGLLRDRGLAGDLVIFLKMTVKHLPVPEHQCARLLPG